MFKLDQSQSYYWPVKIESAIDGGKRETETFDAQFKRLPQSRIDLLPTEIMAGKMNDKSLSSEVLVGWKGIVDAKNEEVPFSESARDRLLDVAHVAKAVVGAFFDSLANGKRKNLSTLPSDGPAAE